ncbi:hypothetical protein G6F57_003887 [Rhizopus arrhizus]|uniref:Radical SAM core domain-containing protein n=1 Tax=Rhizopus oryzae TaxID=64495 RepID=A0A9P6XEN8_RHIOR|nr:hypothetical protein G6F30_004158 [Rhizopus arrhizus]KAG1428814.1 hypothetical protein G6F58_000386 [Rhizopus delemar]KAG1025282.1 hypothetical protein G6F26_005248 [Rhizopus arrhizus]KAG1284143.1 hypothetical protein G6F65_003803 [Rhizopus arrhizus]KAG1311666.1 hypothetical protein G6F64_003631 [Rhizopus arrhizus]
MVTLSTVGYGAVLPSLIADVLNTLRKRNDWGGYVSDSSKPFILIIGSFRPEQVTEILDGFLNAENTKPHLNVVFLDINRQNEELKFLERNSMWGHRIQFIHGSVLDEQTLKRVQARSASAIFTLSDQDALDPHKEDERNTVRLWSLYCHTVVHNVDIYTYNLSPSTAIYQKMAKEVICVREFKQYLLALNCRCRGASTMLTNLLHQRQPMDHYDESWQAQYDDGSCNEIYMDKPPLALIGLPFKEAAWIVYTECQVILFGVKSYLECSDYRKMLLNPENNYIIKTNDLCVYMCESPREVNDVNNLNIGFVREKINRMKTKFTVEKTTNEADALNNSYSSSSESPALQRNTHSIHRISSVESNRTTATSRQYFQLSRLPIPRMTFLTGDRRLANRLGQLAPLDSSDGGPEASPMCYLLDTPATLRELTIESAEHLSGHIVVCMHHKVSNIFKFIFNLRSSQLKANELQDIVFLCTSLPTDKAFEPLCRFPKVFFMLGDCQQPDYLIKAGVKRAKQIVVMSERECLDQNQRTSDSPAIMTSHLLDLLLQSKSYDSSHIVNLVEKSNIRFMHLLQGKDVAEEIDVFYTPAYAAGNVVVDSLLSNVLLSQTYYKPDIVSVIKALCGLPGLSYDKDTAHILTCSTKFHPHLFRNSRHLMLVVLPPLFIGKSFSALFKSLILDHEVVALGLLRAPDENMGNDLPFVYTNPVPSLILKRTDKIYVNAQIAGITIAPLKKAYFLALPQCSYTTHVNSVSNALLDNFNRHHTYLRISLTEKCNLRCTYCMPEEGIQLTPSSQLLTKEEILRLAGLFVKQGVTKIRLTGGEPTVRSDILDIVQGIGRLKTEGLESLAMTSNGIALKRKLEGFYEAGLDTLNISLDTLNPYLFEIMTRRRGFDKVMGSIDQALQLGIPHVKVNTVVMRGVNDKEVLDFVAYTKDHPVNVRFIEYMPFDGNKWKRDTLVPYSELIRNIEAKFGTLEKIKDSVNDTTKHYQLPGYKGKIGFITSMTDHFCSTCNRLRITADGSIKVCLFGSTEVSLRDLIRKGKQDDELIEVINKAVKKKKKQHAGAKYHFGHLLPSYLYALPSTATNSLFFANNQRFYSSKSDNSEKPRLTHTDPETGEARMVSVTNKTPTKREAKAIGRIILPQHAYNLLKKNEGHLIKGDVLTVAKIAGIQAAKSTSNLIPLCHPLLLGFIDVRLWLDDSQRSVECESTVQTTGKTGVEMEALTATSVALLTVYDMCKAATKDMKIENIRVIEKTGGKSGPWKSSLE